MRTLESIDADIAALGRPVHPGVASVTSPLLITGWRDRIAAWRASNPAGDERYTLLLEEREQVELAAVQGRANEKRASRFAREAGMPERVHRALLTLERKPAVELVDRWLPSPKLWLVLAGGTGTGKSVAAGYALKRSLEVRRTGAWVTSAGFATLVGGFSGQADCDRLKHVDSLVVDDFGTEHLTSFAEAVFFEVLAARHENCVRTIVTTNLDPKVFAHRMGSRLADRIRAECHFVTCTGKSMRGAA